MKKFLLTIFIFCMLMPQTYASGSNSLTVNTTFKQTVIENVNYNIDGTLYLPLIPVCEALGAVVFESESGEFFIISRDGDVVTHTLETDSYLLNSNICYTKKTSLKDSSGRTAVPSEMIEKIFGASLSGSTLTRYMQTNYYNELVSNLLNYCIYDDFYPENFSRYFKFYCANPTMDPGVVINSVNIGLDKTAFQDAVVTENPYSENLLVNKLNRLPDGYVPENLVAADKKHTLNDGREYLLDAEAYGKFTEMFNSAAEKGLKLRIVSAYRTFEYQDRLFNSYKRNYGSDYAEKYSAHPGYSEHHTGLAVDLNSLYTTFEKSKEYAWLKDNAHLFGFIERYTRGNEYITGYAYEPWHYRYVGQEAAKIIYENNMTFEEYYAVYVYDCKYTLDKDRTWANVLQVFHR